MHYRRLGNSGLKVSVLVSTVITGASRPEQVQENLGALAAMEKFTPEIIAGIEQACTIPEAGVRGGCDCIRNPGPTGVRV